MTVADLKAILDTLPDDVLILHQNDSEEDGTVFTDLVEWSLAGHWEPGMDGHEATWEEGGYKPVNAIVIRGLA